MARKKDIHGSDPPERVTQRDLEPHELWDINAVYAAEYNNGKAWLKAQADRLVSTSASQVNYAASGHELVDSLLQTYGVRQAARVTEQLIKESANFEGGVASRAKLWMIGLVALALLVGEMFVVAFAVFQGNMPLLAIIPPGLIVAGTLLAGFGLKDLFLQKEDDLNTWQRMRSQGNHGLYWKTHSKLLLGFGVSFVLAGTFIRVMGRAWMLPGRNATILVTLTLAAAAIIAAAYWKFYFEERAAVLALMDACQRDFASRNHGKDDVRLDYQKAFTNQLRLRGIEVQSVEAEMAKMREHLRAGSE